MSIVDMNMSGEVYDFQQPRTTTLITYQLSPGNNGQGMGSTARPRRWLCGRYDGQTSSSTPVRYN
jgi:hypothetical protein